VRLHSAGLTGPAATSLQDADVVIVTTSADGDQGALTAIKSLGVRNASAEYMFRPRRDDCGLLRPRL